MRRARLVPSGRSGHMGTRWAAFALAACLSLGCKTNSIDVAGSGAGTCGAIGEACGKSNPRPCCGEDSADVACLVILSGSGDEGRCSTTCKTDVDCLSKCCRTVPSDNDGGTASYCIAKEFFTGTPPSCPSNETPPADGGTEGVDLYLERYQFHFDSSGGTVTICINKDPVTGAATTEGNTLIVKNTGTAVAGPFAVGVGLIAAGGTQTYLCAETLKDGGGLGPGSSAAWNGPWCCTVRPPAGQYHTYAFADVGRLIAEKDESNNTDQGTALITIP